MRVPFWMGLRLRDSRGCLQTPQEAPALVGKAWQGPAQCAAGEGGAPGRLLFRQTRRETPGTDVRVEAAETLQRTVYLYVVHHVPKLFG